MEGLTPMSSPLEPIWLLVCGRNALLMVSGNLKSCIVGLMRGTR